MVLCYCIKCKQKVELKNGKIVYYKNGVPAERGECSVCGSKVSRILNKEERLALKADTRKTDEQS